MQEPTVPASTDDRHDEPDRRRRRLGLWSWCAFAVIPVLLGVVIAGIAGVGPAAVPAPIVMPHEALAGEAAELHPDRAGGEAVWGRPLSTDLSQVSCRLQGAGSLDVAFPVGPTQGRPTQTSDDTGGSAWLWLGTTQGLSTTADQTPATLLVCSGGGLTSYGVTHDPGPGSAGGSVPAWLLGLLAGLMVVVGSMLRSASRRGTP